MIEYLVASPAMIVRELLIENDFGVMPGIRQIDSARTLLVDDPQLYTSSFPDEITYGLLLKDTAGYYFGRDQKTKHRQQHPGVHLTVYHPDERGFTFARGLEEFFETVENVSVTIGEYIYNIQGIRQPRQIIQLGEEKEKQRQIWTLEVFVAFQDPPRTLVEEE